MRHSSQQKRGAWYEGLGGWREGHALDKGSGAVRAEEAASALFLGSEL